MAAKKSVLVIGGGPAGMVTVAALKDSCDVKVYERARETGGQWACVGDSSVDKELLEKYGERHSSLYNGLWINGPKEAGIELPDFPFDAETPSYFKAARMLKYLRDYCDNRGVTDLIKCHKNVESVTFDESTAKFTVITDDLDKDEKLNETFDHVVVATGHFSYPHDPHFAGEETFPGKYVHAHDFIDGKLYKDMRVLTIGGSYSSEDIALQCWKFGAKCAHITHRNAEPFGYPDFPDNVVQRPILTHIEGSRVHFKDGTSDEYDAIIKCTGYLTKFNFLGEKLTLNARNVFVPPGLYKQCVSMKNKNLFFIGMQDLFYTYTLFQAQAYLVRDIISGKFVVPDKEAQEKDWDADNAEFSKCKDAFDQISFQTKYCNHLTELTGEANVDAEKIFVEWEHHKHAGILTFRDKQFTSMFTGFHAPKAPTIWAEDME